jgi:predicted tellurium resistance membrane protein TerC
MNEKKIKRDWWQKGRAFDLWSIPHFLFGMLMAFLPPLFGISLLAALALTLILALAWEMYEKFVDIKETVQNILLDVILPIVAFTLTSYILRAFSFSTDEIIVAAVAVGALYLFTNISGWRAYRRRNRNFTR